MRTFGAWMTISSEADSTDAFRGCKLDVVLVRLHIDLAFCGNQLHAQLVREQAHALRRAHQQAAPRRQLRMASADDIHMRLCADDDIVRATQRSLRPVCIHRDDRLTASQGCLYRRQLLLPFSLCFRWPINCDKGLPSPIFYA